MPATTSTQQDAQSTRSALIKKGQVINSFNYMVQEGYNYLKMVLPILKRIKEDNMAYDFIDECFGRRIQYESIQEIANASIPEGFCPIQHGDGQKIDIFAIIDAAALLTPGCMTQEEIEELKDWIRHG